MNKGNDDVKTLIGLIKKELKVYKKIRALENVFKDDIEFYEGLLSFRKVLLDHIVSEMNSELMVSNAEERYKLQLVFIDVLES